MPSPVSSDHASETTARAASSAGRHRPARALRPQGDGGAGQRDAEQDEDERTAVRPHRPPVPGGEADDAQERDDDQPLGSPRTGCHAQPPLTPVSNRSTSSSWMTSSESSARAHPGRRRRGVPRLPGPGAPAVAAEPAGALHARRRRGLRDRRRRPRAGGGPVAGPRRRGRRRRGRLLRPAPPAGPRSAGARDRPLGEGPVPPGPRTLGPGPCTGGRALGHGAVRVHLFTDVANTASQAVAERAGFAREGVVRSCPAYREGPRAEVVFSGRVRGG